MKTILLDTSIDYTSWDISETVSVEMTEEKVNMSDDLVKRLRELDRLHSYADKCEAASRIEKLEAELHSCFHRIEELQAALLYLSDGYECCPVSRSMRAIARTALEGKDD